MAAEPSEGAYRWPRWNAGVRTGVIGNEGRLCYHTRLISQVEVQVDGLDEERSWLIIETEEFLGCLSGRSLQIDNRFNDC